jgi:hypothetical protein
VCLIRAASHSFRCQLSLSIHASEKKTHVYLLAQIRALLFDALRHTSSQLTIPGTQVELSTEISYDGAHFKLLDDCFAYPAYFGVESKYIHSRLSRRVGRNMGTGTELFSVLKGLLRLEY